MAAGSVKHEVTIGSTTYTLDDQTRLLDLRVQAALAVPVHTCRLSLGPVTGLTVAPADAVSVSLGYNDTLETVFTGTVATVDRGMARLIVHAASAFQALVAARYNLVYENTPGGDIVSDLVSRLEIQTEKVEAGLTFAAYALGEEQTVYAHLCALARQCGFDLYATQEDKLVFAKYRAATTHDFTYGVDILAFTLDEQPAPLSGVDVYGESPASHGQGTDGISWLTKKEVKGSAGDKAGRVLRVIDPTARTEDVARQMATAILAAGTATQMGTLKVLGAPGVKLGDAVNTTEMPLDSHNGTFKVTGVTHTLNSKSGFVTTLAVQAEE